MLKKIFCFVLIIGITKILFPQIPQDTCFHANDFQIVLPKILVRHISKDIEIIPAAGTKQLLSLENLPQIRLNENPIPAEIKEGKIIISYKFPKKEELHIQIGDFSYRHAVNPIPLWMSILPPLIAIVMALVIREVFSALFLGILVGTTMIYLHQGNTFFIALFQGIFAVIDSYLLESVSDHGHLSIILFSMLIGGMVSLITKNGGMKGVVNKLSKYANSPRSGQFITWLLGILIFFDDYANTLVVGNTMRPVTDKLKISREKLAYIVDSTAAPVAAIAFITTWIGAELSYIQNGISNLEIDESAYSIFIHSLAYSFYPILTLVFILLLIYRNADYGPMLTAENKARKSGIFSKLNGDTATASAEMEVSENVKARWFNAVIPVIVIIFGTFAGLVFTGWNESVWQDANLAFSKKLSFIIGNADSYKALLWSSISGVLVALLLTIAQKLLSLKESIESLMNGFKTMLTAVIILILAWSIALITEHLHTADFISQSMLAFSLSPYLIPTLTFILAALVSFSTGSSWGTMAILYPLLLPASWLLAQENGLEYAGAISIFYNVVASVLAGSVLGDHCSPISDTTILSSLASRCNHIEHVRTQLPYALSVGAVAIFLGVLPASYGISSYILFPTGIIILYLTIRIFGKKVNTG